MDFEVSKKIYQSDLKRCTDSLAEFGVADDRPGVILVEIFYGFALAGSLQRDVGLLTQ